MITNSQPNPYKIMYYKMTAYCAGADLGKKLTDLQQNECQRHFDSNFLKSPFSGFLSHSDIIFNSSILLG